MRKEDEEVYIKLSKIFGFGIHKPRKSRRYNGRKMTHNEALKFTDECVMKGIITRDEYHIKLMRIAEEYGKEGVVG